MSQDALGASFAKAPRCTWAGGYSQRLSKGSFEEPFWANASGAQGSVRRWPRNVTFNVRSLVCSSQTFCRFGLVDGISGSAVRRLKARDRHEC